MDTDRDVSNAVARFVGQWVADRLAGSVASLDSYLSRFPGAEPQIARCFAELDALPTTEADVAAPPPADDGDGGSSVGPYRLLREIGRGGQAAVFLADDARFGRRVAVKVLEGVGPSFEAAARRLKREAEIVARLDHPGLCAVLDAGFARGRGFVAMRYVEGETLQRRLARRREQGRPPDRDEVRAATEYFARAARALHAAHEAGVVHRDVKPANLMVAPDGAPVVLDFGLAHDAGVDGATLTATGAVFGTPAYMAPEQARGAHGRPDRRLDVFSLGASLYEALTLRRAFDGPTREAVLAAVLDRDPPDVRRATPAAGADLSVVVATALAKEPDRRYATAAAFADDLERTLRGEPISARPVGAVGRLARWARRRPAVAALLLVIVLGSAGTAVWTRFKNAELSRTLDETLRLSDVRRVRDLRAWDDRLWPISPGIVPGPQGVDAWLATAAELAGRRGAHEATLARLGGAATRPADSRPTDVGVDAAAATDAWRRELLQGLLVDLDALELRTQAMRRRRERCLSLAAETVLAAREDWAAVVAEVARDPRYRGLRLTPQLGLVPLGRDPASGLFEFADRRSGALARRDPATGRVALAAESGLVFVLVPPGTFRMGAVPPSDDAEEGEPHVDPAADRFEAPVREVALDGFLISKFELTAAQFRRATEAAAADGFDAAALNPIGALTWQDADDALRRLGCALPTEAQWEYAARAGTTTPWWTGDRAASLAGAANLLDRRGGAAGLVGDVARWLDDGYAGFAPVGSFRPNPWGLHDVVGNAMEWCRDEVLSYGADPRAGDGFRNGQGLQPRAARGGSYREAPAYAGSAIRCGFRTNESLAFVGVRPIRPFDS